MYAPSGNESQAKRRKLRKGTHSCWECKRRKMRCIFDPLADSSVCKGCQRRGSPCISQEYPEEEEISIRNGHSKPDVHMAAKALHARDDAARCSESTLETPNLECGRTDIGIPTPYSTSTTVQSPHYLAFYQASSPNVNAHTYHSLHTPASSTPGKYEPLSRFLHASLPSLDDHRKICTAGSHPAVLSHEPMTIPYSVLDQTGLKKPETLLEIPGPTEHPVLIARHMLLLATFLQHLHPDIHKELQYLSEPPWAIMDRLTRLAIRLVTTDDDLLGSAEALECIMIESAFQANIGNLRRSWVAGRRALNVAQLMGFNRPAHRAHYTVLDPRTQYHPELMWFRVVFFDRYLCLLLGLSQGSPDWSMASEQALADDTPMGRLERMHCSIAGQILERNESRNFDDPMLTRTLDAELQKAARSLPSSWWIAPHFDKASDDAQTLFWSTRRIFAQLYHYNLLNQLHLPYVLRASSPQHRHEYSRMTCANASREVLTRFITLRNFNEVAYSCRTIDFVALMSAITLLLVHLLSNGTEAETLLAHQYHSDRAIIEQVQKNMEQVNRINSDALSARSADLLRRLLMLDTDTANINRCQSSTVTVHEAGGEVQPLEAGEDTAVSVHIPYFGIIKIGKGGMRREAALTDQGVRHSQSKNPDWSTIARSGATPNQTSILRPFELNENGRGGNCANSSQPATDRGIDTAPSPIPTATHTNPSTASRAACSEYAAASGTAKPEALPLNSPTALSDFNWGHDQSPQLTAGGNDWVFQGVDMAFFEGLMGGMEGGE